jgi:hypothetical protein
MRRRDIAEKLEIEVIIFIIPEKARKISQGERISKTIDNWPIL